MGNALANIESPEDFFNQLPTITKYWLISALVSAAVVSFGVVSYTQICFYWPLIWQKFEVWRLITNFSFFGKFSFGYLFKLMMLVSFSWGYESDPFPTRTDAGAGGRSGDFAFMILVGAVLLWIIAYFVGTLFLSDPLLHMVIYMWSKRHPDQNVTLLFGMKCRGLYLPFVLAGLSLVIGKDISPNVIGSLVGHLYYFIIQLAPATYGKCFLTCPDFLYRLMESYDNQDNYVGGGQAPPRRQQRREWGAGRPLGET